MAVLKVRDRTTNKFRDVFLDDDDFERLKDYKYLIDKNSKEPFREVIMEDGKRPRVALKRDVLGFELGDPRRVCYVNKAEIFDCRRSNLKTKADDDAPVVVKVKKKKEEKKEKKVKVKMAEEELDTTVAVPTTVETEKSEPCSCEAPVPDVSFVKEEEYVAECTAHTSSTLVLPDSLEVKKSLVSQLGEDKLDKLLALVPMEAILGIWAETHGYKKTA